ncbi:MAG TPA: NAD(P)/FAD-dependent oxidoreductase [Polyangiaceae bacterium]|jgi:2-polyprenyl-6-methoxyphenol hydroxylase-like FAD-dependent oxidoreductase|nr:NAD(P)/FAD-dependent oxidoreductase [Polyangiaceae bacterium]
MNQSWDVIIVGARCAGATLATHLARAGKKVLLLEASPRGTNLPLSTHFIQPPGVEALDRLGLGDVVRRAAPETATLRMSLDDSEVLSEFPKDRGGRCVRRSTIDPLLQNLAEASGADLRDRHRVTGLVRDGERVTGVVASTPDGEETFMATLVVGADGPNSIVAKLTGVEEYLTAEASRGGYFFYFHAPAKWERPWDAALEFRGEEVRYVFRCDGDLILAVVATPLEDAMTWGKDWKARTLAKLAESDVTGPLTAGQEPVGKGCGLMKTHYFYRRPVGPGFALVGDAGHFKDFVTGQGMTDAFLDSERLASAILDGREEAFTHYWRERDVETLPLHFDALQQGAIGFNNPLMRWVIARLGRRPDLRGRAAAVASRGLSPADIIPMPTMLKWMGEALLRGRFDVLAGFLAMGKTTKTEQEELAKRVALLAEARVVLDRAPLPQRAAPVSYRDATANAALVV